MRQRLSVALEMYQEQEDSGGDMVAAGRALALHLGDIISGPICGMPRETVLREKLPRLEPADEQTDAADEQTDVPLDDYGYPEYRP
jgi:hypothetical protein